MNTNGSGEARTGCLVLSNSANSTDPKKNIGPASKSESSSSSVLYFYFVYNKHTIIVWTTSAMFGLTIFFRSLVVDVRGSPLDDSFSIPKAQVSFG